MKKQAKNLILCCAVLSGFHFFAQKPVFPDSLPTTTKLFQTAQILPLKLRYSQKDLRKLTNDSTYMNTLLSFEDVEGIWKEMDVQIRGRGNYRLKNCYFPPVKLKIKKAAARGTLFEGNKKLKLVLPCHLEKANNDLVLKEYIAYKLFEALSTYHYKVRLVDISFEEEKGRGIRQHQLRGFLIEDIDNVAERHGGKEVKRTVHPLQQEVVCSVKNDFFQYMIGNTDFSIAYRHNEKLIFVDKNIIPIPYDFDMSGLVDASYAVVSRIQNEKLTIDKVTDRLFRGFRRSPAIFQQVRGEFLGKKQVIMSITDQLATEFSDPGEYIRVKEFLLEFFEILEDDTAYEKEILAQARIR